LRCPFNRIRLNASRAELNQRLKNLHVNVFDSDHRRF
jgi:hypothetical protein